ncbi:MAG: Ppx/GppA family phosphatase [Solirubrobacterales bacterium]|nr:Ppx/GppA family phosphatase [Solirubrobacterales bacterium]
MPSAEPSSASSRRVAVIDIGTNSTRLLVADVADGLVTEIKRESKVTGLGRGVDHSGQLSAEGIEAVCATVKEYVGMVDQLGASTTSVLATSAVRDAENGSAFVAELRERFGLSPQVIDGDEEARLTYLGCISERTGGENLLVVDVGGGSTEIIIGRGDKPDFHTSLQAGVVRHTERFLTSDPPDAGELEKMAGDIKKLIDEAIREHDFGTIEAAIAVAGTPTSLAAMDLELDPYDPLAVEGHRLPLRTIQWWLSKLSSVPLADRKLYVGLQPDRAGAIVAGVVILIEVMRVFDLDEIQVSEHDILYGAAIRAS